MNASGVDDSKLDWRHKPTNGPDRDGTCVCVPDPVGLPDFHDGFSNATYLGRAKMVPQWQSVGTFGPPSDTPVVVDHYVKWNFHLFVGVESRLPVMFSSPYGGTATYGNWSIKVENGTGGPDDYWPEWRENPSFCLNVVDGGQATCKAFGLAPAKIAGLAFGFIDGALADGSRMDRGCLLEGKDAVLGFKGLAADFSLKAALAAGWGLQNALVDCKAAPAQVAAWGAVLTRLPHPSQLLGNVTQNVQLNSKDIAADLALAALHYERKEWADAGVQMGMVLRRAAMGVADSALEQLV